MKVETYEVEEIKGEFGVMAADSESLDIIEKLGLEGQKRLSNPDTATRQPYRTITQLESNVFAVLFPARTEISKYDMEPIPLRVLQVAAYAKDANLFKRLEIWHPESPRDKDPLLIGVGRGEYDWQDRFFLLARWGDALLTFDEMAEKARQIWLKRTRPKLEAIKARVDMDLARLESIAAIGFSGGELEQLNYTPAQF